MSRPMRAWSEAEFDAAFEEVTCGLGRAERERLVHEIGVDGLDELELAVAELHVAALGTPAAPPAGLLERVRAQAPVAPARRAAAPEAGARAPRAFALAAVGWAAAAGLLAYVLLRGADAPAPEPAARRGALLVEAGDVARADWQATADPLAGGVRGDVVWSRARQEGYMRFASLPVNDPRRQQYQLWIFDKSRPDWEARPIDGGVFDVRSDGEVVVPIDAKLHVDAAALFAITLEAPGGVVVSSREHLLATASP